MATIGRLNYQIVANTNDFTREIVATKKELRDAKRVMEDTRTPAERLGRKFDDLATLQRKGVIDGDVYNRRMRQLRLEKLQSIPVVGRFTSSIAGVHPALIAGGVALAGFTAGLAIGRRVVSEFASAVREQLGDLDELSKASSRVGIAGQSLRELRFAAGEAGVEAGAFDTALGKMNRNIAEAAQGTGEAKEELEQLGLSARDLQSRGPHQAFLDIADAIAKVEDPMTRAQVAQALFGRGGIELLTVLKSGRDGIEATSKSFRDLYGSVTDADLAQVAAANDAVGRVKESFTSIAAEAAVNVAPAIQLLAEELLELTSQGSEFGQTMREGIGLIGPAFAIAGDGMNIFFGELQLKQSLVLSTFGQVLSAAEMVDQTIAKLTGREVNERLAIMANAFRRSADKLNAAGRDRFGSGISGDLTKRFNDLRNGSGEFARNQQVSAEETEALAEAAEKAANEQQRIKDLGQKTLEDLLIQVDTFGRSAAEVESIKLALEGVDDETVAAVKSAHEMLEELRKAEELQDSIDDFTKKIQDQTLTMGMGAEAAELFRLRQQGATDEQLAAADAAVRANQRMRDWRDAMEEGRRVTEQFRSPAEKARDELDHLRELFDQGAIDQTTYSRAVSDLRDELAPPITTTFETPGLDSAVDGSRAFAEAIAGARDAVNQANATGLDVAVAQDAADRNVSISDAIANRANPSTAEAAANRDLLERIADILESIDSNTDREPIDVAEAEVN